MKLKNHDLIVIACIWLTFVSMVFSLYFGYQRYAQQGATLRTVYKVCQFTRITEASETACSIAQDNANVEYLCKQRNASNFNDCWVEQK